MTVDYKKKYLKYKSKYLEQKKIKSNSFKGGSGEIEQTLDKILDKNKIDSDTLNTILANPEKNNLLVIIYAHWCVHCTTLIKESGEELVKHEQSNNIKFLDGTQISTDLNNKLEIRGFPTILKINNKSTPTDIIKKEYIGDRTVNSMISFLKED